LWLCYWPYIFLFWLIADGGTFATAVSAIANDVSLLEFFVPRDQAFDEGKASSPCHTSIDKG